MKRNISIMALSLYIVVCCISCSQEHKVDSIKDSFIKICEKDFREFNEDNIKKKEKAVGGGGNVYSEGTHYTYDIIKTDSLIAPYQGVITIHYKIYTKTGSTEPWRISYKEITTIYSYQDGKWVYSKVK